jgi:endo-1,4-beta-D-glucanase Y
MSGGASGAPVGGTSNTNGGASAGAASGGKSQASGGASAGGAGAPAGGSAATDRFPFPQNKHLAACSYPTNASAADAERAYSAWKTELLTSSGAGGHLRVQRPNSPGAETNSTVSEGIAYGMLIAVAMSDQHTFDELWKYSQTWLDANGLMNWYINAAGTQVLGSGAATDADEDMAWALVMADRKWGGAGTLGTSYLELAKAQIGRIWNSEVDHGASDMLLPGDNWGANPLFNPSYFAPNQYRIFGAVTASPDTWKRVIDTGYSILDKSLNATSKNATNGLVPAWCGSDGMPKSPPSGAATNYQYDSARTPFRIGLDYCFNSEARAKTYLGKVSSFFSGLGAGAIVDGYNLDGTPHPDPDTPTGSPQSAVFVGCAAVGAMHDAKYQSFIDDAYTRVASGQLLARSRYYNLSWTALNLLMLSGNFLEYGN